MPEVIEGESRKDFVKRCIPIVMKEGIRGNNVEQNQAIAVCFSIYRESESGKSKVDEYHEQKKKGPEE